MALNAVANSVTDRPVHKRDIWSSRVLVRQIPSGEIVAYDFQKKEIIYELVDYSIMQIQRKSLSPLTVFQGANCLARLLNFLYVKKLGYINLHDGLIIDFRNEELQRVLSRRKSSSTSNDDELRAKDTVNQKLRYIFNWIYWLVQTNRMPERMIGPHNCPITLERVVSTRKSGGHLRTSEKITSPLLYPRVKLGGGRHIGRTPSEEQLEIIKDQLVSVPRSSYVKERNSILMDIARATGFRRSSISSLRRVQFDRELILSTSEDTISIVPDRQKFHYANDFQISTTLAVRVLEYIEGPLNEHCDIKGAGPKITKDRLFLSDKNCKPLKDRSITAIFSKASKFAGMPRGSAIHSLRARFADEKIVETIMYRLQNGLDTSTASITHECAQKLGHKSPDSLFSYVSANQSRLLSSAMQRIKRNSIEIFDY